MSSQQLQEQLPTSHELIIAEYTALRDEILHLTDMQHQLTTITFLTFGTLMAAGIQFKNTSIILIYPILALFVSASWFNYAYDIDVLGDYIESHIEITVGTKNIGWENYTRRRSIPHPLFVLLGARGIFPVTQVITLVTGVSLADFNPWLFLVALLSTIASIIFMLIIARAQRGRKRLFRQFNTHKSSNGVEGAGTV